MRFIPRREVLNENVLTVMVGMIHKGPNPELGYEGPGFGLRGDLRPDVHQRMKYVYPWYRHSQST